MRKVLSTLIALLCLVTASLNMAYAGKSHRAHRAKRSMDTVLENTCVSADSILEFARSLIGTRYCPGASSPLNGFDCSGFVSYVFKKFDFHVPRSSSEFAEIGEKVRFEDAKPGDIILFTGTKTYHKHSVGHVGIVLANDGTNFKFIHSTSGKEYSVTITDMDDTYRRRFVKIVRLLKQNDDLGITNTSASLQNSSLFNSRHAGFPAM